MKKLILSTLLLFILTHLKAQPSKQADSYISKEAVKELKKLAIDLHPNPSNGSFVLTFMKQPEAAMLSIYDVLGNYIIKNTYLNQLSNEINLNNQAKGIYFLEIIAGKEKTISKIVVQ
ncbi:MAG: T9SS type A sorting domain-containing protein [Bacteroidota bacterium]